MSSILVIGYTSWDIYLPTETASDSDCKKELPFIESCGGGPSANAAYALAKLGCDVKLITNFGDDLFAKQQKDDLQAVGVNIDNSITTSKAITPRAVIFVSQETGCRTIYWSRGNLPLIDGSHFEPEMLNGIDLVLLDNHEPDFGTVVARKARLGDIPVVLDAGTPRTGTEMLMQNCSDIIASADFVTKLTGENNADSMCQVLRGYGAERVAVTVGDKGAFAIDSNQSFHVQAFDVPVVDTTAAGDLFHAGYSFALSKQKSFLDSLEYGAAVAALGCISYGGRAGCPHAKVVEKLIATCARKC